MFPGSPTTMDPHHHRAPSLGELHQELEAEQEAHVVSHESPRPARPRFFSSPPFYFIFLSFFFLARDG